MGKALNLVGKIEKGSEAAVAWGGRKGVTPALKGIAKLFGTAVPLMPVVKTAYLGFLVTGLVAVWIKLRGEKLSDFGLRWPAKWLRAIGLGLGFFVLILIYAAVLEPLLDSVLAPIFGPDRGAETFGFVRGNLSLYLFALPFIWLFAALGEEFFYRGFLLVRFVQAFGDTRLGWTAALLLQACLFGLGHLYQGWTGVVGVAIYGFVYGLAMRVSGRNLLAPFIAHGLLDTLGFSLLYLGKI